MVRVFVCLLMFSMLPACQLFAKKDPVVVYKTVKVPVPQCPSSFENLTRVERPKLLLEKLTKSSPPGQVATAYKISVKQLQQYSVELEVFQDLILGTCPLKEGSVDEVK